MECPAEPSLDQIVDGDVAWMLVASALVLLMTPGLAFFYGGLVRRKNVINTLMMSFVAVSFLIICLHFALHFLYVLNSDIRWVSLSFTGCSLGILLLLHLETLVCFLALAQL